MKILTIILGVLVFFTSTSYSQKIGTSTGNISFFQETTVEDIHGKSKSLMTVIDTKTNNIVYKVSMRSFKFEKALMEEHFNENYVESDKYPYATYYGKINESIDWSKDGSYDISSNGKLTMHGVSKEISEKGKLIIKNGVVSISNEFKIKFTDYGVEIPKLLIMQLSDVVDVKIETNYLPLKN